MTPERLRQLEELYQAARECEASDREGLLARAEPELRREVEALLAQSQDGLIDHALWEDTESLTQSAVNQLKPGDRLGPYEIDVPIGAGGMGEVFRARDTRLRRTVAIKILSRDKTSDPQRRKRFMQEARAASALNHPNIVTLRYFAGLGIEDTARTLKVSPKTVARDWDFAKAFLKRQVRRDS